MAKAFGSQFVVIAVDAKNINGEWFVQLNGGRIPTEIKLFDWVKECQERGAGEILFTSMDHDGTKAGFALEATAALPPGFEPGWNGLARQPPMGWRSWNGTTCAFMPRVNPMTSWIQMGGEIWRLR